MSGTRCASLRKRGRCPNRAKKELQVRLFPNVYVIRWVEIPVCNTCYQKLNIFPKLKNPMIYDEQEGGADDAATGATRRA